MRGIFVTLHNQLRDNQFTISSETNITELSSPIALSLRFLWYSFSKLKMYLASQPMTIMKEFHCKTEIALRLTFTVFTICQLHFAVSVAISLFSKSSCLHFFFNKVNLFRFIYLCWFVECNIQCSVKYIFTPFH